MTYQELLLLLTFFSSNFYLCLNGHKSEITNKILEMFASWIDLCLLVSVDCLEILNRSDRVGISIKFNHIHSTKSSHASLANNGIRYSGLFVVYNMFGIS